MPQTPADRGNDPFIGRLLDGRYLIGSRIARGGMATVYEARDTRLDRTIAVKIMHPGMGDDEEFARRFKREARAAARLAHPNVVAVFDQGDDDGLLYLVMEYVPGRTMRDLIRTEAPISPLRALTLMDPVLNALAAAHAAGLIHRDVKPENVLLADDGSIKVADFGLAKAVNSETQASLTSGALMGTVSYLSPELVVEGEADARADVYAAGVLIYELLTGQKPHKADSPIQVAYKHVHEDIAPPSQVIPGLPAYVDALVARATARDMALRPMDAGVLLHQVRRVAAALEHGVVSDDELTAELTPGSSMAAMAAAASPNPALLDSGSPAGPRTWGMDEVYDQENDPTSDFEYLLPVAEPAAPAPAPAATRRAPERPSGVAPLPPRPRPRGRGKMVAAVLALALLVGFGWWFFIARYTTTPGVLDLAQAEASAKVEQAGLTFKVGDYAYSESVAKGSVVSTDPAPGDRILDNGTVVAVLSKGPERHAVPALRGKLLDKAQQLLLDARLTSGQTIERYHEQIAEGRVIRTDPASGTELRRDTAVDLYVSKGPRPIDIPDFTGKSANKASKALSKLGFKVSQTQEYSDTVAAGLVVAQDPSSGTGFRGDTVSLQVSKGPRLVQVPDTRRMGVQAARAMLRDAGFKVRTVRSEVWIGLQYVLRSDPPGGTMAPKGSTITLYLV